MPRRNRQQVSGAAGFTIVELLVATAVTALLIGMMITMTSGVLTAWNRTSGTLNANNQGKIALDAIAQDLQSAVFRYDPANPNAVAFAVEILDQVEGHNATNLGSRRNWTTTGTHSQILKPTGRVGVGATGQDARSFDLSSPELADCRYGFGGVWLRFFSNNLNGALGASNTVPSAVGYQIVRRHITGVPTDPNNPSEVRYMLLRSEVADQRLLDDGYDLNPATVPNTHYAHPNPTVASSLISPGNDAIIAANVIDFGVRLYVRGPGVLDPVFPVRNYSAGLFDFDDNHTQYLADGSQNDPFPDVADIMVRVLTEEGARQIRHLEAGILYPNVTGATQRRQLWWDIAEANSRVFTRRVYLNSRPY